MAYFEQIYQLAKKENIEALQKLLSRDDICIDENNSYGITPAGKLAAEGNKNAVMLLMRFGAGIQ